MAVRPLSELRIDLIDSLSAYGGFNRYAATTLTDRVIDVAGNAVVFIPGGPTGFGYAPSYQSVATGPTGSSRDIPLMELVPGPSFHATRAEFRKMCGGLPMWKDGPPQPGWLRPGLLLARKDNDLLYRVTTLSGNVDFKRLMDMPGLPAYTTEYRNLHKDWLATEFILCDECRSTPESDTICDSCASRKLRKTGATRWNLPKFCDLAYDDPAKTPPTRFERDEVI